MRFAVIPNPLQLIDIRCQPPLVPPQQYAVHPHHRNQSPEKSQWTIGIQEEFGAFQMGVQSCGGYEQHAVFGLHLVDNQWTYLGMSPWGEQVMIAKFTRDATQWHGYPYLHTEPSRSVPREVIDGWWNAGLLRKAQYSRILKKQPC